MKIHGTVFWSFRTSGTTVDRAHVSLLGARKPRAVTTVPSTLQPRISRQRPGGYHNGRAMRMCPRFGNFLLRFGGGSSVSIER